MTPEALLAAARALLSDAPKGVWSRAAALTARQALETALDQMWARRAPGLQDATARAQLACLTDYLGDEALAAEVRFTWSALSHACHHHAYELAPTASELGHRFDSVERLIARLG